MPEARLEVAEVCADALLERRDLMDAELGGFGASWPGHGDRAPVGGQCEEAAAGDLDEALFDQRDRGHGIRLGGGRAARSHACSQYQGQRPERQEDPRRRYGQEPGSS